MAVVGSHNAVDPERLFSKGKKADGGIVPWLGSGCTTLLTPSNEFLQEKRQMELQGIVPWLGSGRTMLLTPSI